MKRIVTQRQLEELIGWYQEKLGLLDWTVYIILEADEEDEAFGNVGWSKCDAINKTVDIYVDLRDEKNLTLKGLCDTVVHEFLHCRISAVEWAADISQATPTNTAVEEWFVLELTPIVLKGIGTWPGISSGRR